MGCLWEPAQTTVAALVFPQHMQWVLHLRLVLCPHSPYGNPFAVGKSRIVRLIMIWIVRSQHAQPEKPFSQLVVGCVLDRPYVQAEW